jgi:hypothetical protein
MPGNTKRRRRKHRGTQTGSIDRRGRKGRPRNRQEAMARQKRTAVDRRAKPPTWRGAAIRGGFFALLLFPVSILFGQTVAAGLMLAFVAAFFYIPLGYYTDLFFHRRFVRKQAAKAQQAKAARAGAKGNGKAPADKREEQVKG